MAKVKTHDRKTSVTREQVKESVKKVTEKKIKTIANKPKVPTHEWVGNKQYKRWKKIKL